jgi:hypothetical protein
MHLTRLSKMAGGVLLVVIGSVLQYTGYETATESIYSIAINFMATCMMIVGIVAIAFDVDLAAGTRRLLRLSMSTFLVIGILVLTGITIACMILTLQGRLDWEVFGLHVTLIPMLRIWFMMISAGCCAGLVTLYVAANKYFRRNGLLGDS